MERWDEDDEGIVKGAGDTGLPLTIGVNRKGSMMNLTKYTKHTHNKDEFGEDLDKYIKNNVTVVSPWAILIYFYINIANLLI